MRRALELARRAGRRGEVPIGALLVVDGKAVADGYNLTRTNADPTAHAEIVALQRAARKIGNERFIGATMYATLEPCAMCAGALIQARVARLVYAASDPKAGACGSALTVIPHPSLNHRPEISAGLFGRTAGTILTQFFKRRRAALKAARR